MSLLSLEKYRSRLADVELLGCRGVVQRVAGLTVESKGPPVGMGQICGIRLTDGRRVPAEVVGFHGASRVLMPLEGIEGIAPGDTVEPGGRNARLPVGPGLLGRVLDGLGRPIDGKGPITEPEGFRSVEASAPPPLRRPRISEPLSTGVRSIDALATCGKGQRMGIFAGSGVGKSTLLGEIARTSSAEVNVVALVGERGREVREFIEESLGPEGLARSVIVVATSDTSPVQRVRCAFTAVTLAEYFRDAGRDVLMMMDSVTRLAHAQREIGLAAGEPPATKGYCPSVFGIIPKLTERLGRSEHGSITGMLTVLVESDDMNDPVADCVRSLLDGHLVLSRKLAEQGHYPAVDILQSISRLQNGIIPREFLAAAQKFRAIYATYRDAEDLINIGAFSPGSNRRIDKAVSLIDRVNEFLIQPTGKPTPLDRTASWIREITEPWDFLVSADRREEAEA